MISVCSRALCLFLFVVFAVPLPGQQLYKWVEDDGTVHMTDNVSQIPERYRNQVEKRTLSTPVQSGVQPEIRIDRRTHPKQAAQDLEGTRIPYTAFEGTSRRIIIPVTFNDSVTAQMILDTGSPGLLLSPKLADRLGLLDEQQGKLLIVAGGIGGTVPAILTIVEKISIGEARADFLPATITKMFSDDYEGLIGMDFMSNYNVSIDTSTSVVAFKELPPDSVRPGGHDENWWRHNFQTFSRLRSTWGEYLDSLSNSTMASSEIEKLKEAARNQYEEADKLHRKLDGYASQSAVPTTWRR